MFMISCIPCTFRISRDLLCNQTWLSIRYTLIQKKIYLRLSVSKFVLCDWRKGLSAPCEIVAVGMEVQTGTGKLGRSGPTCKIRILLCAIWISYDSLF